MRKQRRFSDRLLQTVTILSALTSVIGLGLIFHFVFANGMQLMSFDLFTTDFHAKSYIARLAPHEETQYEMPDFSDDEDVFVISRFGIAIRQGVDITGAGVIEVHYIHPDSVFNTMISDELGKETVDMDVKNIIERISYVNHPTSISRRGAELFAQELNDPQREVYQVFFSNLGGGIRGSFVTTLWLIALTLVMALPMGVLTAVYFNEFAPVNFVTKIMRTFIETLTGVPSIIYGLLGISVFVPLSIAITPAVNTNLIAGSMTLAVIILPIIIRTTEESLRVVPEDHRAASLALGANRTQTTFKIVLPQAVQGILTSTFLAIGRIIGESAALIFVLGTIVRDRVSIFEQSTSLSVHIWSMMTDEPANVALSSTIALLILAIVLLLNISIKFSVFLLERRGK